MPVLNKKGTVLEVSMISLTCTGVLLKFFQNFGTLRLGWLFHVKQSTGSILQAIECNAVEVESKIGRTSKFH